MFFVLPMDFGGRFGGGPSLRAKRAGHRDADTYPKHSRQVGVRKARNPAEADHQRSRKRSRGVVAEPRPSPRSRSADNSTQHDEERRDEGRWCRKAKNLRCPDANADQRTHHEDVASEMMAPSKVPKM